MAGHQLPILLGCKEVLQSESEPKLNLILEASNADEFALVMLWLALGYFDPEFYFIPFDLFATDYSQDWRVNSAV